MDIFAACINGQKIKQKKVKNFTYAIESSIKAQLKRIVQAWRNWTSQIVDMKRVS
jgi:hypothetical protein